MRTETRVCDICGGSVTRVTKGADGCAPPAAQRTETDRDRIGALQLHVHDGNIVLAGGELFVGDGCAACALDLIAAARNAVRAEIDRRRRQYEQISEAPSAK